ncbi:molecular chaperone [Pseudomonas sp. NPDC087697]|uniref:fimbrial biogenesis chaperone n=1 Tax=Pseudomonas sp. NPDC087697 TaxID=3364447 RepID=UPI00382CB47E
MKTLKVVSLLLCLGLLPIAGQSAQAGVMAEQTRLIFTEGQRQRSLMLANTNTYPVVVQTWIDNGEGDRAPENAVAPMIALPSVFRLQPGALQGLRIIYSGDPLPKDRESVIWLNLYEIPPAKAHATDTTQVAVAMNTQMKIFYRPKGLSSLPEQVPAALTFRLEKQNADWVLVCRNNSPYHASFSSLRLVTGAGEQPVTKSLDMMAPPLSEKRYGLDLSTSTDTGAIQVRYTLIDDNGHYQDGNATLQPH